MSGIARLVNAADRLQGRQAWLAVPVATWKKFQDDRAGSLAALIAYYGFAALFPLLLVLVTALNFTCTRRKWTRSSRGACGRGR